MVEEYDDFQEEDIEESETTELLTPSEDLLTNRPPFRSEDLKNAHYLRSTSFQKDLLEYIDNSRLYTSAKSSLKNTVQNYFNPVWFLGNFHGDQGVMADTFGANYKGSRINSVMRIWNDLKLDMLENTLSMCRSDRMSPDYINIKKALKAHFKAIISRAEGPQRERIMNTKFTSSQEVISKSITAPSMSVKPKEKKSFWGR